jgi:uncharacterized protein
MDLLVIFLTGLTTGGVSCAALQAGLLISVLNRKDHQLSISPTLMFLVAKLFIYLVLGYLLGTFGQALSLNLTTRIILQVLSALYMFATALNLLDVHPIFRYVVITPPKFIQRKIRSASKSDALFAPGILGLFTVFIPCGVTQAMEILAINSENGIRGALIMGSFILGTMPLFSLIGLAATKLTKASEKLFFRLSAALLIVMALYSLNGALSVLDSPISISRFLTTFQKLKQYESNQITITVGNHGYTPIYIQVKNNQPVTLTVNTKDVYSCATAFTLRAFNIYKQLGPTDSQTFTFTPTKTGRYTYSCSMGMYTGTLEVI